MDPAVTADEPTPLKAGSVSSVSGDGVISVTASNGAVVVGHEPSTHVLVAGRNGAATSDIPMSPL